MENKLELKHLAPYLPYELIIHVPEYGNFTLCGYEPEYGILLDTITFGVGAVPSNYKPLLIPFSELTQEQWIEVFKAGSNMQDVEPTLIEVKYRRCYVKNRCGTTIMSYDFERQFFYYLYHPCNQLTAFNKLFELHADVYGLLEAGLALNKLEHGK